MNVDRQDINIVVDKEIAEVKADDVKDGKISEIPAHTIDSQKTEIPAQAEKPKTEKPIEDKVTNTKQPKSEKPIVEEVLLQIEKLKAEVQTQIEEPKENVSKEEATDGNKEEIVKVTGQVFVERKPLAEPSMSIGEF